MTEVEGLTTHLEQLQRLREMDLTRIFPNHGDPAVITRGGYGKSFIDATTLNLGLVQAYDADKPLPDLSIYTPSVHPVDARDAR